MTNGEPGESDGGTSSEPITDVDSSSNNVSIGNSGISGGTGNSGATNSGGTGGTGTIDTGGSGGTGTTGAGATAGSNGNGNGGGDGGGDGDNDPSTYTVSGTVYRASSDERLEGALVVMGISNGKPLRTAIANGDGNYTFEGVTRGKWGFTALEKDSRASPEVQEQITGDKNNLNFRLSSLMNTRDAEMGKWLFGSLIVGLLALAVLYVLLHLWFPPTSEPLSPALNPLIDSALEETKEAGDLSASVALTTTVSEISSTLEGLVTDTIALSTEESQVLAAAMGLVTNLQTSIEENNKEAAETHLLNLRRVLREPLSGSFFWVQEPWRFLEVLFWGLAGILAQLIMTTGTYLRWGRFYREGLFLHIAQLVTIPLIALVIVFLLSLISIRVTLSGGTEVSLDLRDPRLLAAVSFLIGIGPFLAWRFAQNVSKSILSQTKAEDPTPGLKRET
ncbi:MAG TPA: hypothetical protein VF826_12540 [Chloroflexia bacterium]